MTGLRDLVAEAESSVRAVLHEPLTVCSVPELDGLLVELTELCWRVSELAARIGTALDRGPDGLRLDDEGQQRFANATEALQVARADLGRAVNEANGAAGRLHAARQVTSTIGSGRCDRTQPTSLYDEGEVEF